MLNKKRLIVFTVFIIVLFFMMSYGAEPETYTERIYEKEINFYDGYDNKLISNQILEVGTNIVIPTIPVHKECNFIGWYTESGEKIEDFVAKDSMNIYSKCDFEKFTVTFFDTVDNKIISSEEVVYGGNASKPNIPTHAGYKFDGWSKGYTEVTSNITVNALYSKMGNTTTTNTNNTSNNPTYKYYTVDFYDNETGGLISSSTVREGASATFPTVPVHANKVFDHYTGKYTNVKSNQKIVIYYRDLDKYTVLFDKGEHGSLSGNTKYSAYRGSTFKENNIVTPSTTANKGYTFIGWNQGFSDDTIINNNITIKAKYKANDYYVTFDNNGGSGCKNTTVTYDSKYGEMCTPTLSGYDFTGWSLDGKVISKDTKVSMTSDSILKATWAVKKYKVTFKDYDGKVLAQNDISYNTSINIPVSPTRDGYEFKSWDKIVPEKMPANDLEFTAVYQYKKYSLVFKDYDDKVLLKDNIEYNSSVSTPSNPKREGYTFKGWNGTIPEKMPANDLEFTAKYSPNTYQITFDLNNGSDSVIYTLVYDSLLIVPKNFEKPGYKFVKWDKTLPETVPAKDTKYTAVWERNKFNVLVYYVYEDGSVAAPTYEKDCPSGDRYNAESPNIKYYKPSLERVFGIMGNGAFTPVTVVYSPINDKNNNKIADELE